MGILKRFDFISPYPPEIVVSALQDLSDQNCTVITPCKTIVHIFSYDDNSYKFTIDRLVPYGRSLSVRVVGYIHPHQDMAQIVGIGMLSRPTVIVLFLFSLIFMVLPMLYRGYLCVFGWIFILAWSLLACISEGNKLIDTVYGVLKKQ